VSHTMTDPVARDVMAALDAEKSRLRPLSFYIDSIPDTPSRSTLVREIQAGHLKAIRHGVSYLVDPDDFVAWMRARRAPIAAAPVVGGASA